MKAILFILALLALSEEVNASCLHEADSLFSRALQSRGDRFLASEFKLGSEVREAISESDLLSLLEKRELEKLDASGSYELYLVAASHAGRDYLEMMVIHRYSCEIARSFRIFSE